MGMKGTITIPKTEQNCKDGKCGHLHELPIEIPDSKPIVQPATISFDPSNPPQLPFQTHDHDHPPEPKPLSHDEMSELMPGGVNFAKCKGDDCGKPLKNKKLTKNFKKCTNCNSNTVPKSKKYCPTCGIDEPTEEEDKEEFWDESEIDTEILDKMLNEDD